ncbi:MAG: glycosyltransferase family 2 protein, partial [Opitutaceae bacterium]
MEISFIIPLFNRLDLTRPCLESLQASLPKGVTCEIILVDDGSTDGTREWIVTLPAPPFVVIFNEERSGYAVGNNRGARIARGRLLVLLNNDLLFAPGWLEPMLAAYSRNRDVAIVGNRQVRVDDGGLDHAGIIINLNGKPEHLNRSQRAAIKPFGCSRRPAVTGACCLVPRRLFLELGGFDERFRNGGEDVDLCYRARARRLKVVVANRSVVRHHVSASPGRKDHDERNSRRLCLRWRPQLILDGARAWPIAYLRQHWLEPRDYDTSLLWHAFLRWLGVVSWPAREAVNVVTKNLIREEQHWLETLGPVSREARGEGRGARGTETTHETSLS